MDRQEGRSSEALVWLTRLAARPDLHGTCWHGSGLFYLALFTYNQTQDSKQSMPLYEAMLRQYPDHALAERALPTRPAAEVNTREANSRKALERHELSCYTTCHD